MSAGIKRVIAIALEGQSLATELKPTPFLPSWIWVAERISSSAVPQAPPFSPNISRPRFRRAGADFHGRYGAARYRPSVTDEDVYLFSIDDLEQLVDENRQQRNLAADEARQVVTEEVTRFLAESRAQDAGPAIRALRQQADGIRQQTVEQARRMLAGGKSTDEVIEYLANTLTNRLLHAPTQALRQASELADLALAEAITRLLTEERDRH